MKRETLHFDWSPGDHHYIILSEQELKELAKYGIICIKLGREESYYIVTEEEWNKDFEVKESKHD